MAMVVLMIPMGRRCKDSLQERYAVGQSASLVDQNLGFLRPSTNRAEGLTCLTQKKSCIEGEVISTHQKR